MNESFASFLLRYLPAFMGTIIMAIFSAAMVIFLIDATYLSGHDPLRKIQLSSAGLLSLTTLLVFSNVMIARGHRWATGLLGAYFGVCLMLVVPAIQFNPHIAGYSSGIVFPILGLLLLNTRRHREMRQKLYEHRLRAFQ